VLVSQCSHGFEIVCRNPLNRRISQQYPACHGCVMQGRACSLTNGGDTHRCFAAQGQDSAMNISSDSQSSSEEENGPPQRPGTAKRALKAFVLPFSRTPPTHKNRSSSLALFFASGR
jgi:hypothetical protein